VWHFAANVRFYDAPDSHQHDLGSILDGDREIVQPISVLLFSCRGSVFSVSRLCRLPPMHCVGQRRKHHTTMKCFIIAVRREDC
jgi:hypothetical protein